MGKEYESKKSIVFVSPGKSRYNKKEAEAEMKEQGMDLCFDNKSAVRAKVRLMSAKEVRPPTKCKRKTVSLSLRVESDNEADS